MCSKSVNFNRFTVFLIEKKLCREKTNPLRNRYMLKTIRVAASIFNLQNCLFFK